MITYMKCHVLCMCALVRISWVRARQRMDQAMIHHLMINYLKMVNHSLDQCVDFQGFESYDLIHLKYEIIVWNQAKTGEKGPSRTLREAMLCIAHCKAVLAFYARRAQSARFGFESYDLIHLKYEIIVWNQAKTGAKRPSRALREAMLC